MKKLLNVLAVIHLLMCVAALALGIILFNQREILKGRILSLEQAFIKTALTLESGPPIAEDDPVYPERDIDTVSAVPVRNPQTTTFWWRG